MKHGEVPEAAVVDPVAPFAGAWIETPTPYVVGVAGASRALRGRVDGNYNLLASVRAKLVAPFAGAWIETCAKRKVPLAPAGRALRGRVDGNVL